MKFYPKRTKKVAKRTKKVAKKPSKTLVKAIQSVIHKDAENKSAYHNIENVSFNSGINSTGDIQRILPNVLIGSTEYQRNGEQIRLQKLNIKGHMILSTANNTIPNSRIAVRMMVVQPKNLAGYPNVASDPSWLAFLLKKGASSTQFTGAISDLYCPINSDAITTYYDKVTYITIPYIYNSTLGVPTSGFSAVSWDLMNSTKFFNINIKCKNKLLKYDRGYSDSQPTQFSPVLLCGYVHLDGSSPDVTTTQVAVSFDSISEYEDL